MIDAIRKRISAAIQEKVFPGCVIGIVRADGSRTVVPLGAYTYDRGARVVSADSIYDMASITKVIPTASLGAMLIHEKRMSMSDQLIQYLPEFRNSEREKVLIRHLFDYTLSYDSARLATFFDKGAEELRKYILTREFSHAPGAAYQTSNTAPYLLGCVVEKILGESLDVSAEKYFFAPLLMERSALTPSQFPIEEIVPTEIVEGRGVVRGQVHDESAYVLRVKGDGTAGQAGLFSTAPDLLNFLEMLITDGVDRGLSSGLGWDGREPLFMGDLAGPNTFGKTGFTGTLVVFDADRGVAFVLLSNRTYPHRPNDSTLINAVRRDIADIIWKSA